MKNKMGPIFKFLTLAVTVQILFIGISGFCNTPKEMRKPKSFWPGDAWPHGEVVYELDWTLNPNNIEVFYSAVAEYEDKTCIRFRRRGPNDTDYVNVQRFDQTCGSSYMCRWGGMQEMWIGGDCFNLTVLLHELGHALCLGHEDTRVDRDDYVDFSPCEFIVDPDEFDTRGHLYDYWSVMHYICGFCNGGGGWPKMEGVSLEQCGQAIPEGKGLSVLDVDKINDFYDCQGCLRHRWRRTNNLTESDLQAIVAFGQTNDGSPLYLCRAYVGAEVAPGKYNLDEDICYLSFNGTEFQVKQRVQVFTVPQNEMKSLPSYRTFPPDIKDMYDLIRVGRSVSGVTQYAAVAAVDVNGMREVAVGKVYEDDMTRAYIPMQGVELVVTNFEILGCS